jgi:hypothetical protein
MLLAALAKRVMGMSGPEAIAWVRDYVDHAVETPEQTRFVIDF